MTSGPGGTRSWPGEHRSTPERSPVPPREDAGFLSSHWAVAIVFLAALALRLIHIDRPPFWDELYHVMAARSLLEDGTLVISEGGSPYTRARLYTHIVAGTFRVFGESLVAARLPAVLSGAALVALIFASVRSLVGIGAASVVALFLCLDPLSIDVSQIHRFYGAHAVLFWIAALVTYRLTDPPVSGSLALGGGILVVLCLALARHFNITTLFGVLALLFWTVVVVGPRFARWAWRSRYRWWVLTLLLVLAGVLAVHLVREDTIAAWWLRFRFTDGWGFNRADQYTFYHARLMGLYPTLWTLFPLLVLVAAAKHPRPTLFFACIFGVILSLLSFAAQKDSRYLYFAMPAFFAVSGIAVAVAIPVIRSDLANSLGRLVPWLSTRARRIAAFGLVLAAVLFTVGANRAFVHAASMIVAPSGSTYGAQPNWPAAGGRFRAEAGRSTVVMSSAPLQARYYLGRLDASLFRGDLMTREGKLPEFTRDRWLDRPVISEPESLARIMDCAPSGIVLVADNQFGHPWWVSEQLAEALESRTQAVSVPPDWKVQVFRWAREDAAPASDCAAVLAPGLGGSRDAEVEQRG